MRLIPIASTFLAGSVVALMAMNLTELTGKLSFLTAQAQEAPAKAPALVPTPAKPVQAAASPSGNRDCDAYNREIDEAIALQSRVNRGADVARLQGMKQACQASTPAVFRSARS